MASGPEGTEPLMNSPNLQTWVLKVSIHCEGCKRKVRKVLQGVEGVCTIDIDSKQNKVTVTGNVHADSLIGRLLKHGKHSELWSEKKPISTNSPGDATADAKAKGKEKVTAASAVPKIEQKPTNAKMNQHVEESKPATVPETTALPEIASEAVKSDASGEASGPKPNNDGPKGSDSDEPSKSDKEQGEKQASDAEAPYDASGKKTGRKVQRESSSGDEGVISDTYVPTSASRELPNQFPAYSEPVYTMSYNSVHPSTSYAYYATPPPVMPSSYYGYSGYPQPSAYPPHITPPAYAPQSAYQLEDYPLDSYYSSMELPAPSAGSYYSSMELPAPSAGSYDMFNDENPNACNLM